MNVVPTVSTQRMARRLIRATPELGADATISALAHVPSDQIPALVALLARYASDVINVPRLPDVQHIGKRVPIGAPLRLTDEQRREAHRRYRAGERTPAVVFGEREYQRLHARLRAKRRAAA